MMFPDLDAAERMATLTLQGEYAHERGRAERLAEQVLVLVKHVRALEDAAVLGLATPVGVEL